MMAGNLMYHLETPRHTPEYLSKKASNCDTPYSRVAAIFFSFPLHVCL